MMLLHTVYLHLQKHFTKAEHLWDIEVPGAHSISFKDGDTLFVSQVIGENVHEGGIIKCTGLQQESFLPPHACSYYAVAIGPDEEVVARNGTTNEIEIYSQLEKNKVFSWPLPAGKHKGLAVNKDGLIYMCDTSSHSVRVYHPTGDLIRVIQNSDMKSPHYLAVNHRGLVVTCMGDEPAVLYFDFEDQEDGEWEPDWEFGEFEWPSGVAIDDNNDIYVCDTEDKKVVMIAAGGDLTFDMVTEEMLGGKKPFAVAVYGNRLAVQLLDSDVVKLYELTS